MEKAKFVFVLCACLACVVVGYLVGFPAGKESMSETSIQLMYAQQSIAAGVQETELLKRSLADTEARAEASREAVSALFVRLQFAKPADIERVFGDQVRVHPYEINVTWGDYTAHFTRGWSGGWGHEWTLQADEAE